MSVPDSLLYQKINFPYYSRVSEYETDLNLISTAEGVWVDNFSGNFEQIEFSKKILRMGKRVAFVSPELHQRSYDVVEKSSMQGFTRTPASNYVQIFHVRHGNFLVGKMIKAILFDMDGVLIDAKDWHYEALNMALEIFGYSISRDAHLTTFDGLPTKTKLQMLSES